MSDHQVVIFDELVLPADRVDAWISQWRQGYVPGATSRGLELGGIWKGWTRDPGQVTLIVQWLLPTVDAFWRARGLAAADAAVAEFWAATDAYAVQRARRVLASHGAP